VLPASSKSELQSPTAVTDKSPDRTSSGRLARLLRPSERRSEWH